ncbi:MAG: hypothetical protein RSD49_04780 [Hafnia sp.]
MKIITSKLGDRWQITDTEAMPEGGDRKFGMNNNMIEMIENAQKSDRWAERLRIVANAELSEDKECIYVPDRDYFNWFRSVSLQDPEFRTHHDYESGFRLTYPDDTRLTISEGVEEPGAHYGPYYINGTGEDGKYGLVGFSEDLSDIPGILEKLKGSKLSPLPQFSALDSVIYQLSDGFKAEIHGIECHSMDIWTVSFKATITDPKNKIIFEDVLGLDEIIQCGYSSNDLQDVLSRYKNEYQIQHLNDVNKALVLFNTLDAFNPESVSDLKNQLNILPKNTSLKLTCADQKTELLISSSVVKSWERLSGEKAYIGDSPTETELESLGVDSLRLRHLREYTVKAKDIGGASIETDVIKSLSIENLFSVVTDEAEFTKLFDKAQDSHNRCTQMTRLGRLAVLDTLNNGYHAPLEYISDKVIPIGTLIKSARAELERSIKNYGMDMA